MRGDLGEGKAEPLEAGHVLGPGDLVGVTVFRQPDLSGQFRLDGDGSLALPLTGEVQAGGLTTRGLEQAITAHLIDGGFLLNPQVSVQMLTYRPFYILGEIRKPGQYEYKDGMTVINGVALAGGFTYRARTAAASIERRGCAFVAVGAPVAGAALTVGYAGSEDPDVALLVETTAVELLAAELWRRSLA